MTRIESIGISVSDSAKGLNDRATYRKTDDKELFDGAPVGVQVMGQRLQEEKVLAMMSAVNDSLQQYQPL